MKLHLILKTYKNPIKPTDSDVVAKVSDCSLEESSTSYTLPFLKILV